MSADVLKLSAAEAAERVRAGDLGAAELFSFYREPDRPASTSAWAPSCGRRTSRAEG